MKIFLLVFLMFGGSLDSTISLHLNEEKSGHYFIIWTSDASKFSNDISKPIKFDKNKAAYLNYHLRERYAIKPINTKGEDLSKRLKNFMGNEFYMVFYNPNKKEYQKYPNWNPFYLQKRPYQERKELEAKGYKFEDTVLKRQNIKP